MRLLLVFAAFPLLGLLAGCAGPAATAAEPVNTSSVDLPPSYRFDPQVIQVTAGTTVTWTNHDNFTHAVQLQDGVVHAMQPGQSVALAFDTPGTYAYVCTFHAQNMRGTIVVTAN